MSNGARRRKVSRLVPTREKRTHRRVQERSYWQRARMVAAIDSELAREAGPALDVE